MNCEEVAGALMKVGLPNASVLVFPRGSTYPYITYLGRLLLGNYRVAVNNAYQDGKLDLECHIVTLPQKV